MIPFLHFNFVSSITACVSPLLKLQDDWWPCLKMRKWHNHHTTSLVRISYSRIGAGASLFKSNSYIYVNTSYIYIYLYVAIYILYIYIPYVHIYTYVQIGLWLLAWSHLHYKTLIATKKGPHPNLHGQCILGHAGTNLYTGIVWEKWHVLAQKGAKEHSKTMTALMSESLGVSCSIHD